MGVVDASAVFETFKSTFRILNRFLVENMAGGRHVCHAPTFGLRCREFLTANSKKASGNAKSWAVAKSTRTNGLLCSEVKMVLFSRSFVRKRVISLATTASVAATSLGMAHAPTSAHRIHGTKPIQYVADWQDSSDEAPFLAENQSAMDRMMRGITVKPTGDVDLDFVAMMLPHHQGALDMAQAELRYGHNEQLRRMAQEVVVNQRQEIAAMRLAVGEKLSPSVASPTQPSTMSSSTGPHDAMSRHPIITK